MNISFLKKRIYWLSSFWAITFIASLIVRVDVRYWGGWEGEYDATYGFPFAVATRQYDMWIPFLKQFDMIYWGIALNVVFTAVIAIGITTLVLFVVQRRHAIGKKR